MDISVKVRFPNGTIEKGVLTYTRTGPLIRILNGKELESNSLDEAVSFSFIGSGLSKIKNIHINPELEIIFKPKITTRKYSPTSSSQYEMYPPSSNAWFTHISESGKEALFIIQEIRHSVKLLLTIIDISTFDPLAMYQVNPYEVEILFRDTDFIFYKKLFEHKKYDERMIIDEFLGKKPPKWSELEIIANEVIIPDLKIKSTMSETLGQFVPQSFPQEIRNQLMAFLSWLMKAKIPEEDPLDFNYRLQSTPLLRFMIFGHIQCLLEGIQPPQYVRMINLAEKGQLSSGIEPVTEDTEKQLWNNIWFKLQEMFPDSQGVSNDLAHTLNQTQKIVTSLPVTKQQASRSKKAWVDRFSSIFHSLSIRSHLQNQTIGLQDLVYVGSAHRWPHKHLSWSARLGNPYTKAPHIQVMVMPHSAIERIMRARPNLSSINWSASTLNFGLFNSSIHSWNLRTSMLTKSLEGRRTLKQLENEFEVKSKTATFTITLDEAKVLDLLSVGMYLSGLELGRYNAYLPGDLEHLRNMIKSLRDRGILNVQYFYRLSGLASLCLIVKGPALHVQSVSRSFLKYTPSATVRLADEGKTSYIMTRVPEDKVYDILTEIPKRAKESELNITIKRADAYAGYTHDLYSRLLRPDGTWDDDISGLLSQIRS